jgi:hypothetical protein
VSGYDMRATEEHRLPLLQRRIGSHGVDGFRDRGGGAGQMRLIDDERRRSDHACVRRHVDA